MLMLACAHVSIFGMEQVSKKNHSKSSKCKIWMLNFEQKVSGGKSPIGILNKVGPFQEILKIVTNLFIFDRSCQKTITLLVSYKR